MVRMPRLGLPLLGTQLKAEGYKVSIYGDAGFLPWNKILEADLVGVSTTTYQLMPIVLRVICASNVPVVIGGIHGPFT